MIDVEKYIDIKTKGIDMIVNQTGGSAPVIETLNVTPSTQAQTITAPQGTDGYNPVNVSAVTSSIDANITASNIKSGVTILGTTGTYSGSAPAYYIEKSKDANNVLQNSNSNSIIDLTGVVEVGEYVLAYAYHKVAQITGLIDFSDLTSVSNISALNETFSYCTGITSVDLSSLKTVSGVNACYRMFGFCTGLTSVDLSSLTSITGSCSQMFNGCSNLTSVNLGSLTTISGSNSVSSMFSSCTSLTSIDLSSLTSTNGSSSANSMFQGCTSLTSVDLSSLFHVSDISSMFQGCTNLTNLDLSALIAATGSSGFRGICNGCTGLSSVNLSKLCKLSASTALNQAFQSCTSLTSLSFPNLAYESSLTNGQFTNMLSGVTGCTVHFPAEWQTTMSSWTSVTNGFGGVNITVLFDLPNVTTLDLSSVDNPLNTTGMMASFGTNNFFPNITSVDLSGLTIIDASGFGNNMFNSCSNLTSVNLSNLKIVKGGYSNLKLAFNGCTGITSVDLSSLEQILGAENCQRMFNGCTGIPSVDLSKLVEVSGMWGAQHMFSDCTSLTSVDLSSLAIIKNQDSCGSMFNGCTGLTSLYLPSAKDFRNSIYMLQGVTGCTVHLPSNMTNITASDFSGTNTTVVYDLPATNTLTGADTVIYSRNPKYDTSTALAWKVGEYGTTNWTPFYTSGTTDPTVGTTIYSDSACTTPVTTVSSIS